MRTLRHLVLLTALALLPVPPASLLVPSMYAGAGPAAASPSEKKNKKKNKIKKRKQEILKGRHVKHNRKPA
jgi:hypothetical protein